MVLHPHDVDRLAFGTISSLYGLSHGIVDQGQYSALVATVIATAVIPTLIAQRMFLPKPLLAPAELKKHLLKAPEGSPAEE